MSTTPRRSFTSRNPWMLPLILVVLVLGIIAAFVLGPKLKSATSSTATPTPTATVAATAQKIVVTATPGGPTATPAGPTVTPGGPTATAASGAPNPATATPGNGGSTPLPGATPQNTVAGIRLGPVTSTTTKVDNIQRAANRNDPNYTYYLDPTQVVQKTLAQYGFTQSFTIVSPAASPTPTPQTGVDGRPLVKFIVSYQGKEYTIQVVQPVQHGPKGIWVIVTILSGRQ